MWLKRDTVGIRGGTNSSTFCRMEGKETKRIIMEIVLREYEQSGQVLDEVIASSVDETLRMIEEMSEDDEPLALLLEELLAFTSSSRRICRAKVFLEKHLGRPATNPFGAALPSDEAYTANPALALKDEVAGKIFSLRAKSGHQRAEEQFCKKMIREMMTIHDMSILNEVSVGLDTWPRFSISVEYSRLLQASRVFDKFLQEVKPHERNFDGQTESLKLGVLKWLMENGTGGRAESTMQQACIRMLQIRTYTKCELANLQWGLVNMQFESISVSYTRLWRAKTFLEQLG